MKSRNIVVIGASSGGFQVLKELVSGLSADLPAAIFIVWHLPAEGRGILPDVFAKLTTWPVSHARDGEPIEHSRIYIAPPDRHMLIEEGRVRVTRGPKENRFRPAVDPLFRSAAFHYGPDVIGMILSGALDDGTSGLWTVKHRGGITIVQDPNDAEVPSMPENAIREVAVDYTVPVAAMPNLLAGLLKNKTTELRTKPAVRADDRESRQLQVEIGIATQDVPLETVIMDFGELTPYTCPDCHGVLSALRDGATTRFRCHTGHAFTADSLLETVTEDVENSLWNAVRGVDESVILLNHMGDHFAEINQPRLAALFFRKAKEAQQRNDLIRRAVLSHEQLSADHLRQENGRGDSRISEPQQGISAGSDR
jgi:two-component system chemotaxis response regulator CheB